MLLLFNIAAFEIAWLSSVLGAAREMPWLGPVAVLIVLAVHLHAARKPSDGRGAHLHDVTVPMLFLQGTRDTLADLTLLRPICETLPGATLHVIEDADHDLAPVKRSNRTPEDVTAEVLASIDAYLQRTVGA